MQIFPEAEDLKQLEIRLYNAAPAEVRQVQEKENKWAMEYEP